MVQARDVHIQERVMNNPAGVVQATDQMAMHGSTSLEVLGLGAGLECGGVSVRVAFGERSRLFHPGVEEESVVRERVADEADDDGVPQDGGWFGNCVEQLACEVWVSVLADSAEAGADGRCLGSEGGRVVAGLVWRRRVEGKWRGWWER